MSYDYIIFLAICEELVAEFDLKHSNYVRFTSYCVGLGYSLSDGNLNKHEIKVINKCVNSIMYFFALDLDSASEYLVKFLEKDNIIEYERSVRLTNKFFSIKLD